MPTIIIDFAGTLIRKEIIEEANVFRSKILQRSFPTKKEHAHPKQLYKINNQFVEKLTGLKKRMRIDFTENDGDEITLTGEEIQTQIATNLFQIGMFMAAKKYGKRILPAGLLGELQRLQKKGYSFVIISGVRTDIISGVLQIAKIPITFDIYGQPPILGRTNTESLKKIKKAAFVIGDKMNDLQLAKKVGANSIFVTWGHPEGGEEKEADFSIRKAVDLKKIIP